MRRTATCKRLNVQLEEGTFHSTFPNFFLRSRPAAEFNFQLYLDFIFLQNCKIKTKKEKLWTKEEGAGPIYKDGHLQIFFFIW